MPRVIKFGVGATTHLFAHDPQKRWSCPHRIETNSLDAGRWPQRAQRPFRREVTRAVGSGWMHCTQVGACRSRMRTRVFWRTQWKHTPGWQPHVVGTPSPP